VSTGDELAVLPASPTSLALSPSSLSYAPLAFALSSSGKLVVSTLSSASSSSGPSSSHTLASGVTSFVLSPDFCIYTTSSQYSHYASLPVLNAILQGEDVAAYEKEWETRRVERGSLLVCASPSEMSLVMQMPRGNLETVYPRPLVLAEVRREVLA
jgi:elongator complex protein 1